jgi:hypothetical protein
MELQYFSFLIIPIESVIAYSAVAS